MDSRGYEESPIPCLSQRMAQRKSKMDTQQSGIQTSLLSMSRITQSGKTSEPVTQSTQSSWSPLQNLQRSKGKWTDSNLFCTSSIKHSSKASKLVTKLRLAHPRSKPAETIEDVCNCLLSKSGMTQFSKTAENSFTIEEVEENIYLLLSIVVGKIIMRFRQN